MVEARNQATADFSHPETWKRYGFLYSRDEVDFDQARVERVRGGRERAHHVNDDDGAASLTCTVDTFNDMCDQMLRAG